MTLQRFASGIEYCGRHYCGWQRQKNQPSVQAEVERAISQVANEPVTVITAGRTDTGVHGLGQTIHFDSNADRSDYAWLRGVNTALPDDISLLWTRKVDNSFHARFGAKKRSYRYVILNRKVSPAYLNGLVSWHVQPLNEQSMHRAAQALVGEHDFSAYRAAGCQSKQPVRTVYNLDINRHGDWLCLDICADGFLHHMVRNIVGTLNRIGEGIESEKWARMVLESKDRRIGGMTAPAEGLYFASVQYEDKYDLPPAPPLCSFW